MSTLQHYRIFQKLLSKDPSFVETAASLEDARNRLKELTQMFLGRLLHLRLG
jgi:pyoverdine/dityrosine biosynthesis protein Dit1